MSKKVKIMSIVEIENIGPVSHLSIPIPEDGGVIVMKGRNGIGKSRALQAVDAAVTGRGKLDVKDGRKSGSVSAFGVTLKVGRSTRRSGELEVESIEGKLSVADLVDPGIKSDEAADAKRIKALTQLAGAECDIKPFYSLLGGKTEFESVVQKSYTGDDDIVTMAAKIKREIEDAARKVATEAEQVKGKAEGLAASAGEAGDLTGLPDTIKPLQEAFEAALDKSRALESADVRHDNNVIAKEQCQERLARARESWKGATKEKLRAAFDQCLSDTKEAEDFFNSVDKQLNDAKLLVQQLTNKRDILEVRLQKAIDEQNAIGERSEEFSAHEALIATLEAELSKFGVNVPKPTAEQFKAAQAEVEATRSAIVQYEIKSKAKRDLEHAKQAKLRYVDLLREEKRLREAAKGTDEVLSDLVSESGCALRVEGGRLVCDTVRGSTYYGELSAGERWKIAIDIAVSAIGNRGVLTIPQEAWEGLDDINRKTIADHALVRKVVILTAECGIEEEVTPELYGALA